MKGAGMNLESGSGSPFYGRLISLSAGEAMASSGWFLIVGRHWVPKIISLTLLL